jgi:hypothetical protein
MLASLVARGKIRHHAAVQYPTRLAYARLRKGGPVEEERENRKGLQDESDVEAHNRKAYGEGSEEPDPDISRREPDDDPDVEAHNRKA